MGVFKAWSSNFRTMAPNFLPNALQFQVKKNARHIEVHVGWSCDLTQLVYKIATELLTFLFLNYSLYGVVELKVGKRLH